MPSEWSGDTTVALKQPPTGRSGGRRVATVPRGPTRRGHHHGEATYPELAGRFGRSRLVVLACEVGGRWSEECQDFLRQLAKAKVRGLPRGVALDKHGCGAGVASWLAAQRERSLFPSWNDGWRWGLTSSAEVEVNARYVSLSG